MDICFLPPGFSIKDNGSTDIFSHISWYMYLRIFLRYMLEVELLGYKLYSYLPFPWHVSGHGVFQVLVRGVSHPRPLQVRLLHALSITWHFQIFKFGSYLRYCFQTFFVLLSPLILMFSYWHYLKTYFLALKKLLFSIACFWKMFSPRPSNFSLLSDTAITEIIPCIWFLISTIVFSYVVFSLGSFLTTLCSCFTMLLASLLSFTNLSCPSARPESVFSEHPATDGVSRSPWRLPGKWSCWSGHLACRLSSFGEELGLLHMMSYHWTRGEGRGWAPKWREWSPTEL